MYGTIIELDTLTDTDWAGTKYQDLLLRVGLYRLILTTEYRVIIWCLRLELCGTGIYHLKACHDTVGITHFLNLIRALACQSCNHSIRIFDTLCFTKQVDGQFLVLKRLFHLDQDGNLIDEPEINLGNLMHLLHGDTTADTFCNTIDSTVIYNLKVCKQFLIGKLGKIIA